MDAEQPAPAALDRFIGRLGSYFGDFGLPRIAGRMLGLLLLAGQPLSLDDVAGALQVSRASVSTNGRLLVKARLVEIVAVPGDRRDFYAFAERGWEQVIETDAQTATMLRDLAAETLDGLGADASAAQARLEETLTFSTFYAEELGAILQRWRTRTRGAAARSR